MNIRLTIAAVFLVFMVPVGMVYQNLDGEPAAKLLGFLGYVLLTAYLVATANRGHN